MIIVHLAQCCLIFQKKSSPLSKNFRKKTSQKIVAYKLLLIKHNECNKRTGWGKFSQVIKQTGCFKQAKTGKTTPKPYFKVTNTWHHQ